MNYFEKIREFVEGEIKAFEKLEDNFLKAERLPQMIGYYEMARLLRGETFIQENDFDLLKSGNRDLENKIIKTLDNFTKGVIKANDEKLTDFTKNSLKNVNKRWLEMLK